MKDPKKILKEQELLEKMLNTKTEYHFKCGHVCQTFKAIKRPVSKKVCAKGYVNKNCCPICTEVENGPYWNHKRFGLEYAIKTCAVCGEEFEAESRHATRKTQSLCPKHKEPQQNEVRTYGKAGKNRKYKAKCPKCEKIHIVNTGEPSTKLPRIFCSTCQYYKALSDMTDNPYNISNI